LKPPGNVGTDPPAAPPVVAIGTMRIIARRPNPEPLERDESVTSQLWRTY
jgi:hypothetical protein